MCLPPPGGSSRRPGRRQSVWCPLRPQCSAPTHPCCFRNRVEQETTAIITRTANGHTHNDPMREFLLLSTPWSQVRKLRLRRIGSLVKITQPVSDRQNYWYLSSGPPCMCSSPGHQAERQREGAVIGVGGSGVGEGKSSKRPSSVLRKEERS